MKKKNKIEDVEVKATEPKKTLMNRIKFWEKEQTGKRIQLNVEARQSQDRFVRLEAFLNEECKNKCFMCPQCVKKLEGVVR